MVRILNMKDLFDELKQRGFIEQTTDEGAIREMLQQPITCYIGFDPTASSFHVGSLVPIMALAHMQRRGHKPIALIGGGTALVGDPSGKTEMRQMLTVEQIDQNAEGLKQQLAGFIDFENDRALMLNNAEWLVELEYIPFLRDIGRHFSVNRMLTSESCRLRLETGLSFIEFNYVLLQAYDFLYLYRTQNCALQMGGSDQWGNIVAGIDLIRREERATAYGVTFPLITTSSGAKMGKTATGAVWLDANRTRPYEYYQYWINTDDRDVVPFLALFTFLPMSEIREAERLQGAELNDAKVVLAYETTKLAHGEEEAMNAYRESARLFGLRDVAEEVMPSSTVPRRVTREVSEGRRASVAGLDAISNTSMDEAQLKDGIPAFKLFHIVGLADSRGAARRLIEQGGAYVNDARIKAFDTLITSKHLNNSEILLRAGKKRYHRIRVDAE